jgi:hypothetical protein
VFDRMADAVRHGGLYAEFFRLQVVGYWPGGGPSKRLINPAAVPPRSSAAQDVAESLGAYFGVGTAYPG